VRARAPSPVRGRPSPAAIIVAGRPCVLCLHAVGKDVGDFFKDAATRRWFKLHMWTFVSRHNPLTGLEYREDPTIMAYNILNEPRCPGGCWAWGLQPGHRPEARTRERVQCKPCLRARE
jgi:hypothetical protein